MHGPQDDAARSTVPSGHRPLEKVQAATDPPELTVRRADGADAEAVGRLLHDFNTEFDDFTPGAEALTQRVRELLAGGETAILVGGGGPNGVAVLRFRPAIWTEALECYLAELYVVPERRGHGLGQALMEAAIELAREEGATYMDLTTSEDDSAARRLYESIGFSNREGRPDGPINYYYERELRARVAMTTPFAELERDFLRITTYGTSSTTPRRRSAGVRRDSGYGPERWRNPRFTPLRLMPWRVQVMRGSEYPSGEQPPGSGARPRWMSEAGVKWAATPSPPEAATAPRDELTARLDGAAPSREDHGYELENRHVERRGHAQARSQTLRRPQVGEH